MLLLLTLLSIAVLLAMAPLALVIGRRAVGTTVIHALALAMSGTLLVLSVAVLAAPAEGWRPATTILPLGIPWIGAHLRLDRLAAFFLMVVNLGGSAASLFALGYGRHLHLPLRVLPYYPLFLAGMNLVVLADDAFTFLVAWEFMSLTSWAMVVSDHRERRNREAGYIYLVMACFGTLCLVLAFGVLAGLDGGYAFDQIRAAPPASPWTVLVLALVLLGAGSKAGLVPLHVWLPLAHPAAPSHVSALMSGVMTKVAVYAVIRILMDLSGPPAWWQGAVLLVVGAITATMGVLYALMQHDLKRLLAYHTVENIGIIFVGLGLALAFAANDLQIAAGLALVAALFHVLNHSLFKSLLFFGTGAVLVATGERDMERLGGLIHRMPITAVTFLIGAAAISALPPLNGFVSEWLIFQSILVSPALPQWTLKLVVPAAGALLALSAALAATCFVKAFGITFLGRARSDQAAAAQEVDPYSLAAMVALAALCVLAGVLPGLVIDGLASVTAELGAGTLPRQAGLPWLTLIPLTVTRSSYNGLLLLIFIALSASLAAWLVHRLASRRSVRGPAWDCGFPEPSPATQYTAGSFAQPIRRVFGTLAFGAREAVLMPRPGQLRAAAIRVRLRDFAWDWLYQPIVTLVDGAAGRLNRLQFLTIRNYLALVFSALVTLLLALAVVQ